MLRRASTMEHYAFDYESLASTYRISPVIAVVSILVPLILSCMRLLVKAALEASVRYLAHELGPKSHSC
jgi:hypothetical protein